MGNKSLISAQQFLRMADFSPAARNDALNFQQLVPSPVMVEISDSGRAGALSRIAAFVAERRGVFRDYLTAVSGSAGRLVFSLIYFVALANALSLADFGLFATASAAGVMLSRLLAFGFISALYRTATVRPNLIGTFTGGFILNAVLSLPLLAAASLGRPSPSSFPARPHFRSSPSSWRRRR